MYTVTAAFPPRSTSSGLSQAATGATEWRSATQEFDDDRKQHDAQDDRSAKGRDAPGEAIASIVELELSPVQVSGMPPDIARQLSQFECSPKGAIT